MKKLSRKITVSKKGSKTDDESDWSKEYSDIVERYVAHLTLTVCGQ